MKRCLVSLAVVLCVVAPALVSAMDAPHDQTFTNDNCNNCHTLFDAAGSDLDTNRGCVTCHNAPSLPVNSHGFPWLTEDQASPGKGGHQHSWTGFAQNPVLGTRIPTNLAIAEKLVNGRLQCATCHDPHHAAPGSAPDSQHTSIPVGVAVDESGGPAAAGQMTLVSAGSQAKGYRVSIQTVTAGGGTFVLSHDFGLATPSWFNWVGGTWVAGTAIGPGKPFSNGAAVTLDDAEVSVRFSAGTAVGNYWDFYVSYPFLRTSNVENAFCLQCHPDRAMGSTRARGADPSFPVNGVRKFSHPVGEALNSNGFGHDRVGAILDANGVVESTGDGISSNDLRLDNGVVRCTTCHAVHNGDSNSLTP